MALELVYTTVSGHKITFEQPTGQLRDFLEGVIGDAHDSLIPEATLIAEMWAADNPLLGEGIIPERPVITRDTVRHPLYRVMLDLIDRKYIYEHGIDVNELAAGFSMTIPQAAAELDMHIEGVRHLVTNFRLPSWYRNGSYWLRPESVRVYKALRSQRAEEPDDVSFNVAAALEEQRPGSRKPAPKRKKKATKARTR